MVLLWFVADVPLPHVGTSGSYLADAAFRGERRFARNQVQISSGAPRLCSPLFSHTFSLSLSLKFSMAFLFQNGARDDPTCLLLLLSAFTYTARMEF